MYTLYKFHFLNGISEINQLFDDILIIWPAPVCIYIQKVLQIIHCALCLKIFFFLCEVPQILLWIIIPYMLTTEVLKYFSNL